MSENLVLLPFGPGEFLALEPAELAQARDRAREILGAGWAGDRAAAAINGDAPRAPAHGRGNGRAHQGPVKLVSRTGAPRGDVAPQARKVCSVQVR